jgi:hypothetical protein
MSSSFDILERPSISAARARFSSSLLESRSSSPSPRCGEDDPLDFLPRELCSMLARNASSKSRGSSSSTSGAACTALPLRFALIAARSSRACNPILGRVAIVGYVRGVARRGQKGLSARVPGRPHRSVGCCRAHGKSGHILRGEHLSVPSGWAGRRDLESPRRSRLDGAAWSTRLRGGGRCAVGHGRGLTKGHSWRVLRRWGIDERP